MEFIIFGSHAQLKKLDSHLPVRIFGKLMHPSVVKNLGVQFDAKFSFADHVPNIYKTCFIQMRELRQVRQYLTDAILTSDALVSSRLDYCNSLFRGLSSFNMRKLQCIQNTLSRTVTNCNRYSFSQTTPLVCQLISLHFQNFHFGLYVSSQWLSKLFQPSFCLFIVEDMAQDIAVQIKDYWRFLNTTHLYANPKTISVTVLHLMLPQFGMIYLMMFVLAQLLPVSEKKIKSLG